MCGRKMWRQAKAMYHTFHLWARTASDSERRLVHIFIIISISFFFITGAGAGAGYSSNWIDLHEKISLQTFRINSVQIFWIQSFCQFVASALGRPNWPNETQVRKGGIQKSSIPMKGIHLKACFRKEKIKIWKLSLRLAFFKWKSYFGGRWPVTYMPRFQTINMFR